MKFKFLAICCCILVLVTSAGCQLAQDGNGNTTHTPDRLVGVFLTTDYLDTSLTQETTNRPDRLEAKLLPRTYTNPETGEEYETMQFVFERYEGISYFASVIPATAQEEPYTTSTHDDAITQSHMAIREADEGNSLTLTGSVYMSILSAPRAFYFNPVYQTADGNVYTTAGNAMMYSAESRNEEGEAFSQTLTDTASFTQNGVTETEFSSVTVSFEIIFVPQSVVLLQMDAENSVLARTEFAPDVMPEAFDLLPNAAYAIVETHKLNAERQPVIAREIYSHGADMAETFFARADGICIQHSMRLNWQGPNAPGQL